MTTLYRHPTSLRLSDADIPHRQRPRSGDRSRQRRRSPPKTQIHSARHHRSDSTWHNRRHSRSTAQSPLLFQIKKSH
jgi:hypothetical protein